MTGESPQQQFATEIIRKLRSAGHTALLAGGCVRDALMGRTPKDYDVATTATPEIVRSLFGYQRTLAIGASFGVIMIVGPPEAGTVEVATFRTEGPYLDGRRPETVEFCTPEEDAKRRDFTINGMFFDPIDHRVLDYVGGQSDLAAKIVRAIGDPHERVREDKLRMLRAIRFAATLNFQLDKITADAVREMSSELVVVSAERIAQELKKMLVDPHRRRAVELAEDANLLRIIVPELDTIRNRPEWPDTLSRLEQLTLPTFEVAMAALLMPLVDDAITRAICRRLKLSNDESDRIIWLVAHQRDLDKAPQLSLSSLKRTLAHEFCEDLLQLMEADRRATSGNLEPVEFCRNYLATTPREVIDPTPFITGDDLIALGYKPGPKFKAILTKFRDAQLNLVLKNRDEAIEMLKGEWSR